MPTMPVNLIHPLMAITSIAIWLFVVRIMLRKDARPLDASIGRRYAGHVSYHLPHESAKTAGTHRLARRPSRYKGVSAAEG